MTLHIIVKKNHCLCIKLTKLHLRCLYTLYNSYQTFCLFPFLTLNDYADIQDHKDSNVSLCLVDVYHNSLCAITDCA